MATATITSKGQITIPKEIRDTLTLSAGDQVDFTLKSKDEVVMRPVTRRVSDLFGRLQRQGKKPLTPEEMNQAIKKHLVSTKT